MPEEMKLNRPWLVAVWPGMGHVASSAGYYLMAKLGMHLLDDFAAGEFFDVEHVEVKGGLLQTGRLPRSQFFVWRDLREEHDIIVFIGEAQPPSGKYAFCRTLIDYARGLGVERVFTFAAMATEMHPEQPSRVFGAAIDQESLTDFQQMDVEVLEDGQIGGLNGLLLGAAADSGLRGGCLLGEMPHIFAQLPFPKASLAVLEAFTKMAGIEIDFGELSEQAMAMEEKLVQLLAQVERAMEQEQQPEEEAFGEEAFSIEPPEEERLDPEDEQRIEQLFDQAKNDRSKAYELKRELDRLEIFDDYEDRFLDLFKTAE